MTKEQLAALEAQKQQKLQEIEVLRAKGAGDENDVFNLQQAETAMENLDLRIENGRLLLQKSESDAALMARRITDAEAEVAVAVRRGAIAQKDEKTQQQWKEMLTADPAKVEVLRAMKGFVPLNQSSAPAAAPINRISGYNHGITRESNESVLRAMSACQARQTPDVDYADKIKLGRELAALYAREVMPRLEGGDPIALRGVNSLGTLAATMVSIRTLELLTLQFPMLKAIATDFSDSIVSYGDTTTTRTVGIPSVQTFNTTTGWPTDSDHNTVDVSITYNQFKAVPISLTAANIAGTVRRLFDEVAPAQAYALAKDMVDYVYALITSAFSGQTNLIGATNVPTESGAPTFSRSTVIAMAAALNKMGVPRGGRTLLLNQDYYGTLESDSTIITMAAFSRNEIIEEDTLPKIAGLKPINAINLPATVISGSKLLQGFAFSQSALVLATRLSADYVNVLPGAGNGNLQVVTTPAGFSANQVQYVDHKTAQARQRLEVIYGASRGQLSAGQLLTNP